MGRKWTTSELAEYFRVTDSTCRYWRMIGYGPKGVRVGRRVLYDQADVEAFERKLRTEQGLGPEAA